MKIVTLIFACACLLLAVKLPKEKLVAGGIAIIKIDANSIVKFAGNKASIVDSNGGKVALIPIPLETKEGKQPVSITTNGKLKPSSIHVKKSNYKVSRIKIKKKSQVQLSDASIARHNKEQAMAKKAYNTKSAPIGTWDMEKPIKTNRVSGRFGDKRYFNGIPKRAHTGVDFPAPKGTPVYAVSDGVILLKDNLFFNGNTLLIDHGNGLVSSYMHLSKQLVEVGQSVKKGDKIGEVGRTGRVTGANLHFSFHLDYVAVDPSLFFEISDKSSTK